MMIAELRKNGSVRPTRSNTTSSSKLTAVTERSPLLLFSSDSSCSGQSDPTLFTSNYSNKKKVGVAVGEDNNNNNKSMVGTDVNMKNQNSSSTRSLSIKGGRKSRRKIEEDTTTNKEYEGRGRPTSSERTNGTPELRRTRSLIIRPLRRRGTSLETGKAMKKSRQQRLSGRGGGGDEEVNGSRFRSNSVEGSVSASNTMKMGEDESMTTGGSTTGRKTKLEKIYELLEKNRGLKTENRDLQRRLAEMEEKFAELEKELQEERESSKCGCCRVEGNDGNRVECQPQGVQSTPTPPPPPPLPSSLLSSSTPSSPTPTKNVRFQEPKTLEEQINDEAKEAGTIPTEPSELVEPKQELDKMAKAIQALSNLSKMQGEQINRYRDQLESKDSKLLSFQIQVENLTVELDDLDLAKRSSERRSRTDRTKVASLRRDLAEAKVLIEELEEERDCIKSEHCVVLLQRDEMSKKIRTLNREVEGLKHKFDEQERDDTKMMDRLKQELAEKMEKVVLLEFEQEVLSEEILTLNKKKQEDDEGPPNKTHVEAAGAGDNHKASPAVKKRVEVRRVNGIHRQP